MHEVRHAEQQFLAARVLASQGKSADEIATTLQELHPPVAKKAVALKLDGLGRPEKQFAKRMHRALVTDRDVTDMLDRDTGHDAMAKAREGARLVLAGLRSRRPTASAEQGRAACRDLREHIDDVLVKYKIYRQFPTEADAHDVGAGAKLAFQDLE